MSDQVSDDRMDRVEALDTIMSRMSNTGLTLEEKLEISFDLQVESVRALKLMLGKNFVQFHDLTEHCDGKHEVQWSTGKVVASVLKVVVVCATLTGWIMMFKSEKDTVHMISPQPISKTEEATP